VAVFHPPYVFIDNRLLDLNKYIHQNLLFPANDVKKRAKPNKRADDASKIADGMFLRCSANHSRLLSTAIDLTASNFYVVHQLIIIILFLLPRNPALRRKHISTALFRLAPCVSEPNAGRTDHHHPDQHCTKTCAKIQPWPASESDMRWLDSARQSNIRHRLNASWVVTGFTLSSQGARWLREFDIQASNDNRTFLPWGLLP
jgi:hypothetical protein